MEDKRASDQRARLFNHTVRAVIYHQPALSQAGPGPRPLRQGADGSTTPSTRGGIKLLVTPQVPVGVTDIQSAQNQLIGEGRQAGGWHGDYSGTNWWPQSERSGTVSICFLMDLSNLDSEYHHDTVRERSCTVATQFQSQLITPRAHTHSCQ